MYRYVPPIARKMQTRKAITGLLSLSDTLMVLAELIYARK